MPVVKVNTPSRAKTTASLSKTYDKLQQHQGKVFNLSPKV